MNSKVQILYPVKITLCKGRKNFWFWKNYWLCHRANNCAKEDEISDMKKIITNNALTTMTVIE